MSGRTGTCGGSIPPAALTKVRRPSVLFCWLSERGRTTLWRGLAQWKVQRTLTSLTMVRFHHSLPTIFLISRKWFTISLGARLNDTHHDPAYRMRKGRRIPIRSRDGTCIRALLANRCLAHPSNRKASGFLRLLDVIEGDLGGKPPHVGKAGEIPTYPFRETNRLGWRTPASPEGARISFAGSQERHPETNGGLP